MDPSDDVEPSPPKKPHPDCSDAQKAAYMNNFSRRHKKKGRGRSKNTSISTDGTSRRQAASQTMILGLEGEDQGEMLRNIIVLSCIFMEREDAEGCVDGIERKVNN